MKKEKVRDGLRTAEQQPISRKSSRPRIDPLINSPDWRRTGVGESRHDWVPSWAFVRGALANSIQALVDSLLCERERRIQSERLPESFNRLFVPAVGR